MSPKQRARVYREAARIVAEFEDRDSGAGSCSAIADAMFPESDTLSAWERSKESANISIYQGLFSPSDFSEGYWGEFWDAPRACRCIALCFMAAMVEAGDA